MTHRVAFTAKEVAAALGNKGTDDLRAALLSLVNATASCPDALMQGNGDLSQQNLYRWWQEVAAPALRDARAALASVTPDADREGLDATYADESDPDYIDYMTPDLADARGRLHRHRESVPGCGGCRNLDDLIAAAGARFFGARAAATPPYFSRGMVPKWGTCVRTQIDDDR